MACFLCLTISMSRRMAAVMGSWKNSMILSVGTFCRLVWQRKRLARTGLMGTDKVLGLLGELFDLLIGEAEDGEQEALDESVDVGPYEEPHRLWLDAVRPHYSDTLSKAKGTDQSQKKSMTLRVHRFDSHA